MRVGSGAREERGEAADPVYPPSRSRAVHTTNRFPFAALFALTALVRSTPAFPRGADLRC